MIPGWAPPFISCMSLIYSRSLWAPVSSLKWWWLKLISAPIPFHSLIQWAKGVTPCFWLPTHTLWLLPFLLSSAIYIYDFAWCYLTEWFLKKEFEYSVVCLVDSLYIKNKKADFFPESIVFQEQLPMVSKHISQRITSHFLFNALHYIFALFLAE